MLVVIIDYYVWILPYINNTSWCSLYHSSFKERWMWENWLVKKLVRFCNWNYKSQACPFPLPEEHIYNDDDSAVQNSWSDSHFGQKCRKKITHELRSAVDPSGKRGRRELKHHLSMTYRVFFGDWEVTFEKELSSSSSYFHMRNLGTFVTSVTVTTIKM